MQFTLLTTFITLLCVCSTTAQVEFLDNTFGSGGKVITDFSNSIDRAAGHALPLPANRCA